MEETAPPILGLGTVLLAAAALGYVARRLGLPAVIGYLAVGIVAFQVVPLAVPAREQIQLLADVGVVLLLFEVGIEFDLGRLRREHQPVVLVAPIQVVGTTLLAGCALIVLGFEVDVALILGLCIAMSSSVVVVNITRSRTRRTDEATQMSLLGWSLLQDLTGVVLASLLLAVWGAESRPPLEAIAALVAFGLAAIAVARLFPIVLARLYDEHDLFLQVSIAGALLGAGVGAVVFGIPLALAAFVTGLVIVDSPIAGEARRGLLPFRDTLAVLFFVAVGSLLDPDALAVGLGWAALFLVLLVVTKTSLVFVLAKVANAGRPVQVAIGLSQVGEFSIVLASALLASGAITSEVYAALLAAIVISIGASAIAVRAPIRAWMPRHERGESDLRADKAETLS